MSFTASGGIVQSIGPNTSGLPKSHPTFYGDFESGTVGDHAIGSDAFWGGSGQPARTIYSNTRAYQGSQSCSITTTLGVTSFGIGGVALSNLGGNLAVGDELWFRCRLWFPSSWTFVSGAPGSVKGINLAPDTFTSRQYFNWLEPDPNDGYIIAKEGNCSSSSPAYEIAQPRDQWYTFECKWKADNVSVTGGDQVPGNELMICWQDGVYVGSKWGCTLDSASYELDEFRVGDHWNNGAPATQTFWIDELVFYNSQDKMPPSTDADGRPYIGLTEFT